MGHAIAIFVPTTQLTIGLNPFTNLFFCVGAVIVDDDSAIDADLCLPLRAFFGTQYFNGVWIADLRRRFVRADVCLIEPEKLFLLYKSRR